MEETVVRLLREKGWRLATAESCTGGLIAHRITNVPGSSDVFTGGWVTYANETKISQLGVSPKSLEQFGAVSAEVAEEMAKGALAASHADIAVSVTGIAGPGGGSEGKPTGTAWIGLAMNGGHTESFRIYQPRNRHDFKLATSQLALNAVRRAVVPA